MKPLLGAALMLLSCAEIPIDDPAQISRPAPSHDWVNATSGATIMLVGDRYVLENQAFEIRDCSDQQRLCVESNGPINLIVGRLCDDQRDLQIGDHRTLKWSVDIHTPSLLLRDSRYPQILFEYSYRNGVTAIYYSAEGLGVTDTSGPDFANLDVHKYVHRGPEPFLACR